MQARRSRKAIENQPPVNLLEMVVPPHLPQLPQRRKNRVDPHPPSTLTGLPGWAANLLHKGVDIPAPLGPQRTQLQGRGGPDSEPHQRDPASTALPAQALHKHALHTT